MKKIFNVVLTYRGFSHEIDDEILANLERRDRRLFGGTGFSFLDGGRDLVFDTYRKEIAERLQKNLRKAAKKCHIRAKVQIW